MKELHGISIIDGSSFTERDVFRFLADAVFRDEIIEVFPESLKPDHMREDDDIEKTAKSEKKALELLKKKYGSGSTDVGGWTLS